MFLALRHFRFELEGRKFHILTDHLPLVSALSRVSPPWSACQQRQLSYISEFTSDLRHTPGAANVVADNLSRPPDPQLPTSPGVKVSEVSLLTDASNTHIGAALQQKESGGWRPLVFFSAKHSTTQHRYSAFDRELLGVFLALRHFRFELEGRKFHILTDHLPLVSALSRVSPPWSTRQQRQLSYISEFTELSILYARMDMLLL